MFRADCLYLSGPYIIFFNAKASGQTGGQSHWLATKHALKKTNVQPTQIPLPQPCCCTSLAIRHVSHFDSIKLTLSCSQFPLIVLTSGNTFPPPPLKVLPELSYRRSACSSSVTD